MFNSKRHNYYLRLRESTDNMILRDQYLRRDAEAVADGRPRVYMDESWINKNIAPRYAWHDGSPETVDAVPPGKDPDGL